MSIDLGIMPKLGFGLMRLPEQDGQIDIAHVSRMVDAYMQAGMNYFDTAYVYHGGNSEKVIREALVKRYPRDRFMLATKLPAWCMKDPDDRDRIFNEQLERCGVDYFDFYLLHSIEDGGNGETYERLDCYNWGLQKKAEGKIRHLGFSSHASSAQTIDDFLTRHEGVFDFVQIQLNYLDWKLQDAKGKYEAIAKHGLKVVVMEGVRGGRLANLPEEQLAKLQALRPGDSAARWALRWLQNLPEVAVVLSGMTTLEQIQENVETFAAPNPLSEEEKTLLGEVADSMLNWVPCTACRYCTEGCPMELDIPKIIAAYNGMKNGDFMARYDPDTADPSMDPRRCVGCGSCAAICPQGIKIPAIMAEFAEMLKPPRR